MKVPVKFLNFKQKTNPSGITFLFQEVAENLPKELRSTHKTPLYISSYHRPRHQPEISNEFNDDFQKRVESSSKTKFFSSTSSSSSDDEHRSAEASLGKMSPLPVPEPSVIGDFSSSQVPDSGKSSWSSVTREVTRESGIDGPYDDSAEV